MRTCLLAVVGSLLGASIASAESPTFYKDVLPILQANCQSCHRPGEVAPMSLLTYEQARPWARAIKTAVASRSRCRHGLPIPARPLRQRAASGRSRDRDAERVGRCRRTGGQSEADAPPRAHVRQRLEHQARHRRRDAEAVRAAGARHDQLQVHRSSRRTSTKTCGSRAAEMRPGDPAVLHHGKVWVRPPGSKWMENAVPGEAYESESHRDILGRNAIEEGNDILGKFNPGPRRAAVRHRRRGQVRPQGLRPRVRAALHDVRQAGVGRLEARSRARQGAAEEALLLPRRTDGAEPRDSAGRRQRRKWSARSRSAKTRSSSTRSRTCICAARTSSCASSTPDKATQTVLKGNFELRVADGLPVRRADRAAEGFEAAADHPLRQLARPTASTRIRRRRSCGDHRTGTR